MDKIIAYTDGSAVVRGKCKGHGGFGTYFPDLDGKPQAFSQGYLDTKTGRMELTALYYAIIAIPVDSLYMKDGCLEVYSDSEYVVKSFTEKRLEKWISNDWTNTSGKVKNKDLWMKIISELEKRPQMTLKMVHIKSHQLDKVKDITERNELLKNPHIVGNAVADRLADHKRHTVKKSSDIL